MNHYSSILRKRILVAGHKLPADIVVKQGKILNVFTGEFMEGDVAIVDGVIAGIGSYEGNEIIDAQGKIIVPGFIDGHVHIESSMLTPTEFSKVVLQHGVTTVITDPHEIGNVAGTDGIQYMLEDAKQLPLDIFVMLPSCVPTTPFETNGARLDVEQLQPFLSKREVLGLAEVMDFPSVSIGSQTMLEKIEMTLDHGGVIDGHAAGLKREDLNVYMSAGIRTDHECINSKEAKDRLDLGMYLMIREGTVAKNLEALLPVITKQNSRRCLFVTDDKLIDDLVEEGSVDHIVRLAIKKGLDPVTAIQMVTLNTAECFRLRNIGAIAPGYQADFLLLENMEELVIHQVYKKGTCIVNQGELNESLFRKNSSIQSASLPVINTSKVTLNDLKIPLSSDRCNVIGIIPNSLVTKHLIETVRVDNGVFVSSIEKDQLKLAVVERHKATGNIGLGIVKGFQLKKGAIATTVAHDSHNLVVVGTSDQDMLVAIEQVIQTNGGLAVVDEGEVLASLSLPVAGLMSEEGYKVVHQSLNNLNDALSRIGAPQTFNPFLTLSFLTLPVIPQLKLTDKGLFEFTSFSHLDLEDH